MLQDDEQDRIDGQASAWVILMADRALSPPEARELEDWRAADSRHAETFARLERTWGDISTLDHLAARNPLPAERSTTAPPRRRRAFTLAAIAAAFLALLLVPTLLGPGGKHYETHLAETRLLALPDGSQVTLGPRSTLSVRFSGGERRVVLAGGEAFFDVAHDGQRPFFVEAGSSLVRVVGTKFDVNRSADTVRVSVLEGVVRVYDPVSAAGRSPSIHILRAGQRTEVALKVAMPTAALPPVQVAIAAQPPGAWREGRLVYENVRLADLVADLNRYYAPGVTLDDPGAGNLRITAAFKATEIPAFMDGLASAVPAAAEERGGGTYVIRSTRN